MSVLPAVDLCGKRPVWSVKTWPVAGIQKAYNAWLLAPSRSGGAGAAVATGTIGDGEVGGVGTTFRGGRVDAVFFRTWSR